MFQQSWSSCRCKQSEHTTKFNSTQSAFDWFYFNNLQLQRNYTANGGFLVVRLGSSPPKKSPLPVHRCTHSPTCLNAPLMSHTLRSVSLLLLINHYNEWRKPFTRKIHNFTNWHTYSTRPYTHIHLHTLTIKNCVHWLERDSSRDGSKKGGEQSAFCLANVSVVQWGLHTCTPANGKCEFDWLRCAKIM